MTDGKKIMEDAINAIGEEQDLENVLSVNQQMQYRLAKIIGQYRNNLIDEGIDGDLLNSLLINYQSYLFQISLIEREERLLRELQTDETDDDE